MNERCPVSGHSTEETRALAESDFPFKTICPECGRYITIGQASRGYRVHNRVRKSETVAPLWHPATSPRPYIAGDVSQL